VTAVSIRPATVEDLAELPGERFEHAISMLRQHPEQADWWLHLFHDDERLVGFGGFAGPPEDGVVEIGYEIGPEFRGRGYATAAARALVAKAAAAGVDTVIAFTRAEENPSTGVLRRVGFGVTGEAADPADGTVWRWELALP
jgi:[ribosomal protein S5]-alanine N-acetyltransferase